MSEFKTYDHWLESPYQREPVEAEDRDDERYKELEEEK